MEPKERVGSILAIVSEGEESVEDELISTGDKITFLV